MNDSFAPEPDGKPDPPMKPGPQPWNRIAGSVEEQIRRATTPRFVDDVAAARADLEFALRAIARADRRLGRAIVRG